MGGRPQRYPWDKWMKRKKLTLVKGIDYQCQTHGMIQQLRTKATKLGLFVSVSVKEDCIEASFREEPK